MLDATSSVGMPIFYRHWSFGKRFITDEKLYRKGYTGLAYEILQAGYQLEIPRMFAALFLITFAGIALFLITVGLSKLALGSWHDSAVARET